MDDTKMQENVIYAIRVAVDAMGVHEDNERDPERAHIQADAVLTGLLADLGAILGKGEAMTELLKSYENVPKWYA